MSLLLRNVTTPLASFKLEVDAELHGPVTVIFGPSGSGKTTLLDLVAGLRQAASALIQLNDRVLTDTSRGILVPTRDRSIGYVPQDLALFPHLSVRQNLLYGTKTLGDGKSLFSFNHVVAVLEIQQLVQRQVTDLSGGERQRVALARALLASPQILLLDEPLASLDLNLKSRIIPYLARIRDEFRIPMLYVTHDRHELLSLADEMMVLVQGQVAQAGPVREVFNRPASVAVAGLLTIETVQAGRVVKSEGGLTTVAIGSTFVVSVEQMIESSNADVYVCIRAEDVILLKGVDGPGSARNHLRGNIRSLAPEGPHIRVELDCGFSLTALVTKQAREEMELKPGEVVTALIKAQHIHLIPR
jgi:molybdate transport system ATP-binding protein